MSRWVVKTETVDGTKIIKSFNRLDLVMEWIDRYSEHGRHYKIERVD
jgi:hypothetical protein